MSRAFLILLWCSLLALPVFGNANADERGALIGSDAPAGKRYVYKLSDGSPREMQIFFPPNHDPAKSLAPGLILFHGGNWVGGSLAQFRIACAYFASRGQNFRFPLPLCALAFNRIFPPSSF